METVTIEMENRDRDVITNRWHPSSERIQKIFEEHGFVDEEDYLTFDELDPDIKTLKKFLRPPVTWFLRLPIWVTGNSSRCGVCGQNCNKLTQLYYEEDVVDMMQYRMMRFVTWGDTINARLCPYHAKLLKLLWDLEGRRKQFKWEKKLFDRLKDKKGLVKTTMSFSRPVKRRLPMQEKYGPFVAQAVADGAEIHTYPYKDSGGITFLIMDSNRMVPRGGIMYNKTVVNAPVKEEELHATTVQQ